MPAATDIKRKIIELSPAHFQEFCDMFLHRKIKGKIVGLGMKAGTGKTTIGNPDTYFRKENGKYIFVAYTTQPDGIYAKLKEDIEKCCDPVKTGVDFDDIDEIICCHTSSNLSAGDDQKLHELCESKGIPLTIYGVDELADQICNFYPALVRDYLGLSLDTNQILDVQDFVEQNDANGMSAPLRTIFQFREKEKSTLIEALENASVVIVTGKAGVGKTRLVLETASIFSNSEEYRLLCIKNNNLELYEDLIIATAEHGRYLFFVDDANELAGLDHILDYTTKGKLGYSIKIIVTVRDYAKEEVIQKVKRYTEPKIIQLSSFDDDEIKDFLDKNLVIRNHDYVQQIVRIAEGNPRIAYMAGRLAKEKQNLYAIQDVSQLYDAYYAKYVNAAFEDDTDLCFTAGILSIVKAVRLNDMSVFKEILNKQGMPEDLFKKKINQLAKLEVVEIELNQVAVLADQSFANYMLYYVFFQRKLMPFSVMLTIGFKHFRNGVIRSLNTIFNVFNSEQTRAYCRQEILKTWDDFQKNHEACYEDFVKVFHVFRPEEGFLCAQKKIEAIPNEAIDRMAVDFKKNVYCKESGCLDYLSNYTDCEYLPYIMELLLEYCGKNAKTLVNGTQWLINQYGIDENSYKIGYAVQKEISTYLHKKVLEGNEIAEIVGFRWAQYALAFTFDCTSMGRANTFNICYLEIREDEGLRKVRQSCWIILNRLASKSQWYNKIILFLEEYAQHIKNVSDPTVAREDKTDVENLLATLDCKKISFLKVVRDLIFIAKNKKIQYKSQWLNKLDGEKWRIHQLLENEFMFSAVEDYDVYLKNREANIIKYGNKLQKEEIEKFVQNVNDILSDEIIKKNNYWINEGIELILQQFDHERLCVFFDAFIHFGDNFSIRPKTVLEPLNQSADSLSLLSSLKETSLPQENAWLFAFFETLPDQKVNRQMLDEFIKFLRSHSDRLIKESSCRNLKVLDKFIKIEPNIYPMACTIIYDKRHYSTFMVKIYFTMLFHEQIYSPQELLSRFENNIGLLQDIYFYLLKNEDLTDNRRAPANPNPLRALNRKANRSARANPNLNLRLNLKVNP